MDVTIGLSGFAIMTAGFTADVGPAFQIGADVRGEVFSLGLDVRGVLPARIVLQEPLGAGETFPHGADLSQWTGMLVPCARWKYFVGCGVLQAGILYFNDPLATPTFHIDYQLGLGPRVGFEVPLGDTFGVTGFGEALFTPEPLVVTDSTSNVQWRQNVVSGFFGLGFLARFK